MELLRRAVQMLGPVVAQGNPNQETPEEMRIRESLWYGRLYINGSMTSLEYYRAHFGSTPQLQSAPLVFADPFHGCTPLRNNVTGAVVVVRRGRCTFLDKAHNVSTANASGVVIVNMNDRIFRVSGGYALGDKPINVTLPSNLTVVMVRQSALPVLKQALRAGPEPPSARFVPLQCGEGRSVCEPVTAADRAYVAGTAMDSGYVVVPSTGRRYEFVSATFGGVMPEGQVKLASLRPSHGCGMVPRGPLGWMQFIVTRAALDLLWGHGWPEDGARLEDRAVIVERGRCQLGLKALNIQRTGAKLMVVVSREGEPIEPFGATSKTTAKIQLPAIMVNHAAGRELQRLAEEDPEASILLMPVRPGFAAAWLDVAHISWPEDGTAMNVDYAKRLAANEGSPERLSFLEHSYEQAVTQREGQRQRPEAFAHSGEL